MVPDLEASVSCCYGHSAVMQDGAMHEWVTTFSNRGPREFGRLQRSSFSTKSSSLLLIRQGQSMLSALSLTPIFPALAHKTWQQSR
jgi:hypothetical protein